MLVNPYDNLQLTTDAIEYLKVASRPMVRTAGVEDGFGQRLNTKRFTCSIFNSPWDQFVELWAPRIYDLVGNCLGSYGTEPLPELKKLGDAEHMAGATASFEPGSGQVRIASSVEGKPGQTLEKITHEFVHGSLSKFPEGDEFYEEGYVDYSVWVLAHAPVWEPYRESMIEAASFNIKMRRERAMLNQSDYDRKRWAGGLYASLSSGPLILSSLRLKKMEGNYTW